MATLHTLEQKLERSGGKGSARRNIKRKIRRLRKELGLFEAGGDGGGGGGGGGGGDSSKKKKVKGGGGGMFDGGGGGGGGGSVGAEFDVIVEASEESHYESAMRYRYFLKAL